MLKYLVFFTLIALQNFPLMAEKITPPTWLKDGNAYFFYNMETGKKYPLGALTKKPEYHRSLAHGESQKDDVLSWHYVGKKDDFDLVFVEYTYTVPGSYWEDNDVLILKRDNKTVVCTDRLGKYLRGARVYHPEIHENDLHYSFYIHFDHHPIPYKSPLKIPSFPLKSGGGFSQIYAMTITKKGTLTHERKAGLNFGLDERKPFSFDGLYDDLSFLEAVVNDAKMTKGRFNMEEVAALAKRVDALYPEYLKRKKAEEEK